MVTNSLNYIFSTNLKSYRFSYNVYVAVHITNGTICVMSNKKCNIFRLSVDRPVADDVGEGKGHLIRRHIPDCCRWHPQNQRL